MCALVRVELIARSADYEPLYWYYPLDTEHTTVVNELALAYSRQRVPILSVILGEHPERTRLFTEAFKIIRRND